MIRSLAAALCEAAALLCFALAAGLADVPCCDGGCCCARGCLRWPLSLGVDGPFLFWVGVTGSCKLVTGGFVGATEPDWLGC